ncbi:hypothetical protein [Streptomyces olivoreticuli]|uniref:hypothetical protein n=1 Tax=Streptomyces olivoreticuli TaxID=68246 RepID=UPI000E22D385|nr:hypothetical protein [Streptomyces olivoreticuli]
MKRLVMAAAAVGAAAVLAVGLAGSAQAAEGTFVYTTPKGDTDSLSNPRNDHCFNIVGDGHTVNSTDKLALLYDRADCHGEAKHHLDRDKQGWMKFKSVEFVS